MTYLGLVHAPILALALALPAPLQAGGQTGDIVLPRKPSKSDIPAVNHLGERVRGLTFHATSVSRRSDGQMVVTYGFIIGQPNGRANFFYWNTRVGLECHGTMHKSATGAGVGVNICAEKGVPILRDGVHIPAAHYMRFSGTTKQKNHDLHGRVIWTVTRWQLVGGFPDAAPLIAAFDH